MDIKKPQLVKVGAFAYFFEGVLQHPLSHKSEGVAEPLNSKSLRIDYSRQTLKLSDSDRIFGSREFKI